MKKFKFSLLSLAIIIGVCGAFATRPHFDCSNMTKYYYAGGGYSEAGEEGVNYICSQGSGTCTYYTFNGLTFYACEAGTYCTSNCFVRPDGQPLKPLKPVAVPSNTQKNFR
jgi:hypothetical protein